MDKTTLEVLGMHRAQFERAKSTEHYAWLAEIVVAVTSLVSAFVADPTLVYTMAIVALVATLVRWRLSYLAKQYKAVAERARRVLLLIEGLGYKVSPKEVTDIITSFSITESEGQKWEDPEYFRPDMEAGYRKFGAILQESAFFSKHLFALSARQTWFYFIASFSLSIIALFALPITPNQTWSLAIAKIVSILLMFLVSIDVLGMALSYSSTAHAVSNIDDRLEVLKAIESPEHDLILIFGDYNAAVEDAPLIPTSIYQRHHDRLNNLWTKRLRT